MTVVSRPVMLAAGSNVRIDTGGIGHAVTGTGVEKSEMATMLSWHSVAYSAFGSVNRTV